MPARKRLDIEKCEDLVGFEKLEGGDFAWIEGRLAACNLGTSQGECTFDDFAEYAGS